MSHTYIPKLLREQVRRTARNRCGYCLIQQEIVGIQLHIEHILPEAAGGATALENLWLACSECNNHKGSQVEAIDPHRNERLPLFNPRLQQWVEHFQWSEDGTEIIGVSPTGRATVIALEMIGQQKPFYRLDLPGKMKQA